MPEQRAPLLGSLDPSPASDLASEREGSASAPRVDHDRRLPGRYWIDAALGVSAIAISLFSAILTLREGRAMEQTVKENERMVQASTWPYL